MLFLSSFDNTDRIAFALNVQHIHNANFEALWHYLRPYTAHTNVHISIRQNSLINKTKEHLFAC